MGSDMALAATNHPLRHVPCPGSVESDARGTLAKPAGKAAVVQQHAPKRNTHVLSRPREVARMLQTGRRHSRLSPDFMTSAEPHSSSHTTALAPPTVTLVHTDARPPWRNVNLIAYQRSEGARPKSRHSIMHACDPAQVAKWLRAVSDSKLLPSHYAMEGCCPTLAITPIVAAAKRGD